MSSYWSSEGVWEGRVGRVWFLAALKILGAGVNVDESIQPVIDPTIEDARLQQFVDTFQYG